MKIQQFNTIPEAWYFVNKYCYDNGREYTIDRGSYTGQKRKQLDSLAFEIVHPETRPLATEYKGTFFSTDDEIQSYFYGYLLSPDSNDNELYTYGSRLIPQINYLVDMLKESPQTNHATIEIARPEDINLESPPCMRLLSWKVIDNTLQLTTFFRSWCGVMGLPMNLGALQLLNEMIAEMVNLKHGSLICYSDGLHIYDHNYRWFKDC